jgi:hypothetical protein
MSGKPAMLVLYTLLGLFWLEVAVLFVVSFRTRRRMRR